MAGAARPLRLCYGGPVMRLRADQLRPERERMQVGAEIIGSYSVAAAVEIVNVAIEALQRAGVAGITIDFTLPDLVPALAAGPMPLAAGDVEAVRARLDAKDAGSLAQLGTSAAPYQALIEATGPFHPRHGAARSAGRRRRQGRAGGAHCRAARHRQADRLGHYPDARPHGAARLRSIQSWFGFSIFAEGFIGEIGRGGAYPVTRLDGTSEPAMGFSLYPDPLIDAGFGTETARRLFLPLGHDTERGGVARRGLGDGGGAVARRRRQGAGLRGHIGRQGRQGL